MVEYFFTQRYIEDVFSIGGMDLYTITYVRKKDGAIDEESPKYNLLVRTNVDMGSLEKIARPWFLTVGIKLDDLFMLKATPHIGSRGYNVTNEYRSGTTIEEALFI